MEVVALARFDWQGRIIQPGDALSLRPLDAAVLHRRGLIRLPAQAPPAADLERRDIEPEASTNATPAEAPRSRASRRRDMKARR